VPYLVARMSTGSRHERVGSVLIARVGWPSGSRASGRGLAQARPDAGLVSILWWRPRTARRCWRDRPPGADRDALIFRRTRMPPLCSQLAAVRSGWRPARLQACRCKGASRAQASSPRQMPHQATTSIFRATQRTRLLTASTSIAADQSPLDWRCNLCQGGRDGPKGHNRDDG